MQESDSNRGTTPAPEAAIGNAVLRTRMDPRTGEVMQVRPASFWRAHDARRRAEGRTLVEYAQANDLKLSTLRRWSTKLRDGDGTGGGTSACATGGEFLAMALHPRASASASGALAPGSPRIEMTLGSDVRVSLAGAAAERVLGALLASMRTTR